MKLLPLQLLPTAVSNSKQVPSDFTKLSSWVADNIKDYNQRKADASKGIPPICLATAEDSVTVITVARHSFADFQTITGAIHSITVDNKQRIIIWINGGEYWEKITINSSKPFITFYGDPGDMPKIVFNGTAAQYGTVYSAIVAVESDYFMAANVAFVNAAPMPELNRTGAQGVA
uniref:pectinesterase n=1 Tax=Manihot esculenta TaxID=3983 RepID=A0A2C9W6Y8_MANES